MVLSATKGGSRAAAGLGWAQGFPGGGRLQPLSVPPAGAGRCRPAHGLPTTSPSGMNMAELAQQVVKQELPSEEALGRPCYWGLRSLTLNHCQLCPSGPAAPSSPAAPATIPIPPPGLQPQPELWGRGRRPQATPEPLGPEHASPSPTCPRKIWTSCS